MPEPVTDFALTFALEDPLLRSIVGQLLQQKGLKDCAILAPEDFASGDSQRAGALLQQKSRRLGSYLDYIIDYKDKISSRRFSEIPVGRYVLDLENSHFYSAEGIKSPVRLTEKECALLAALALAGPEGLDKEALLARIWGHQAILETHTLETHIYRLRQKIEPDPAQPQILLTTAQGYCLVGLRPV